MQQWAEMGWGQYSNHALQIIWLFINMMETLFLNEFPAGIYLFKARNGSTRTIHKSVQN